MCESAGNCGIDALPVRYDIHIHRVYLTGRECLHTHSPLCKIPHTRTVFILQGGCLHTHSPPCTISHTSYVYGVCLTWEGEGEGLCVVTAPAICPPPALLSTAAGVRTRGRFLPQACPVCTNPCKIRHLPLDCHCDSGVNRQFRRGVCPHQPETLAHPSRRCGGRTCCANQPAPAPATPPP